LNKIGDAGIQALAAHLKGLANLQTLNLSSNKIGDAGIQALAAHLQGLTNLQKLYLGLNKIGDAGVKVLAQHLKSVKGKSIYLWRNTISPETQAWLKQECPGIDWEF
jgi:Ran GTPase-activating protein (RanGAP) involved in mRNA processing and transport